MKKAIILLSGGLDSATITAIAQNRGFACYALSFRYGQRHSQEINCAEKVAKSMSLAEHRILDIDLGALGGSALTDIDIAVPKDNSVVGFDKDVSTIPATYVPARNTIFLSYALAWAEIVGSFDVFIGVNSTDYSGYPDCRIEFVKAFEKMANLATAAATENGQYLTINTPIIDMTKAEIIKTGIELGVDYSLTHSCYDPAADGKSCGRCDSCQLRLKGFAEAGLVDPLRYASL